MAVKGATLLKETLIYLSTLFLMVAAADTLLSIKLLYSLQIVFIQSLHFVA